MSILEEILVASGLMVLAMLHLRLFCIVFNIESLDGSLYVIREMGVNCWSLTSVSSSMFFPTGRATTLCEAELHTRNGFVIKWRDVTDTILWNY